MKIKIVVILLLFIFVKSAFAMGEMVKSEEDKFKGSDKDMEKPSPVVASLVRLTSSGHNVFPKISRSGSLVYQTLTKSDKEGVPDNFNIYTYSNKGLRIVTNDTHNNEYPVFMGEDKIVFESDRLGVPKLWKMNTSGRGGIVKLTEGPSYDKMPDISMDGQRIVFCSYQKSGKIEMSATEIGARWKIMLEAPSIWAIDSDGRNLTQFSEGIKPTWSPDSKKIAFYKKTGDFFHIWVMDTDGGNLTQLTSGKFNAIEPVWSPDGQKIAYSSDSAGNYDIWTQNLDGTEVTQMTIHNGYDGAPAWSPDGGYIYFHSFRGGNWNIWRMQLLKEEKKSVSTLIQDSSVKGK